MKRLLIWLAVLMIGLTSVAQAGSLTGTAFGAYTHTHKWVLKDTNTDPTCTKAGKGLHYCSGCKKTKMMSIKALGHDYSERKVIEEPGDHTPGKILLTCSRCGHTETIPYYPQGIFYLGMELIDDDDLTIRELQAILKDLGYYTRKINGKYDKYTVAAVKKFQKRYGLKADGIAWGDTLLALGIGQIAGVPVDPPAKDTAKLKLTVQMTSQPAELYSVGDVIEFEWELKNLSTKYPAKTPVMYLYKDTAPNKKTDAVVADTDLDTLLPSEDDPDTLVPVPGMVESIPKSGSVKGIMRYTVTEEDLAKGRFSIGFVARGKLNKKEYRSNGVRFKEN